MNFRSAVLAAFLFLLAYIPVHAEDGARVILVLDASGSMWGQIDGKSKMEIAKEVVGKVVANWKPEDELGLVAYGHREKGSCTDIEVLREPGPLDAADYMSAVNALNPKGKTPMTAAVRMAAEALKYTEKKATVILVSDGLETCDPNPCAVAEELEKLGVELTVHTVGFGLDDKGAVAQLKCLAEKTGGTYTTANNASELQKALTKTVAAKPAPPPPPKAEVVEFNFVGHVVMAEGVELPDKFNQPAWEFHESANGEMGERLTTEYNSRVKVNMPHDGDYFVRIQADNASIVVPFKIENGKATKLDVSLEAGIAKLSGFMDDATPMTDDGAAWQLFDATGDGSVTNYGANTMFLTNAGTRKVSLSLGTARVEQDVVFEAGKAADVKMSLGAGVIEATAVFSEGGQTVQEGTTFELNKGEPNLDGVHETIITDYALPTRFKVPAGKYQVVVTRDLAKVAVDVEVKAGEVLKINPSLNAGYLVLTSPADSTVEVYTAEKDLAGERKLVSTEFYGTLNKAYSAGSYHVIAKLSDGTVLGEKDFEVKAGARTEGALP